jgi:hypothetical protein
MGTIISSAPPAKISSIIAVDGFTSITGTTANTLTGSILIPAGTIIDLPGTTAELTARAIKTGVNNTAILRIYINTTSSLSGATLLATGGAPGATDLFQQLERTMFIGKSPINTKVAPPTSPLFSDNGRSTTAESSIVIDWSVPQYIILAVQNASTLDTSIGTGLILKIYK